MTRVTLGADTLSGRMTNSAGTRDVFVAGDTAPVRPRLWRQACTAQLLKTSVLILCSAGIGMASFDALSDTQQPVASSDEAAGTSPAELIDSMSLALRNLNYEGTFVHAQGARLTSMRIIHSSVDGEEFERLVSLDGEAREVIRNNSLVTCIWPDTESVVVTKSKPRDLLPKIDPSLTSDMRYSFSLGAPDRVAGRDTHVINVIPSDDFRYGYRFWIDVQNNMLLRSMLLDGNTDDPVEQVIFTHIEYPESVEKSLFDITGSDRHADRMSWLEPQAANAGDKAARQTSEQADRISFSALPTGYHKVSETYSPTPINKGPVSHVMLSDGMASVSVYVEYVGREDQQDVTLGWSRMGAMNAYTIGTDKALITVVGEVPEDTVEAIAAAVKLAG